MMEFPLAQTSPGVGGEPPVVPPENEDNGWLLDGLTDLINSAVDALFGVCQEVFCWLVTSFLALLVIIWESISPLIPPQVTTGVVEFGKVLYWADLWFPVSDLLLCLALVSNVYIAVIAVRLVRRCLP